MKVLVTLVAGILVTVSTFDTDASYIYIYAGNNYQNVSSYPNNNIDEISYTSDIYDTSMNLSITFTTDAPLINTSLSESTYLQYAGYPNPSVGAGVVNSFMFDDGYRASANLVGNVDADIHIRLETDSVGNILQWYIYASDVVSDGSLTLSRGIRSEYQYPPYEDTGDESSGLLYTSDSFDTFIRTGGWVYDPGSWTLTQIPIPPALWLFGSGILGLIGISRRKKAA